MSVAVSEIFWEYEDQLPELEDWEFELMYPMSRVDWVRMYPYVNSPHGERVWLGKDLRQGAD